MKTLYTISPGIATTVALCYQAINTAREYARSVVVDPDAPYGLKAVMTQVASDMSISSAKIEKRVPENKRTEFTDQYRDTDLLRLDNICRLYARLRPDQQDSLEEMVQLLERGETIQVETVNQ